RPRRRSPGSVLILWACSTWTRWGFCRSLAVARSCRSSRASRRPLLPGRRPLVVARRWSRASTLTAPTDGTTTPLTVHGIARGVLSYLGAADDAIHDLPVHAQLRGDLRHWHAVSACGLHGGVPVPCSGCERFLGHVYGFLRGLQVGHCACAILSCWTVASRSAIRSSTV